MKFFNNLPIKAKLIIIIMVTSVGGLLISSLMLIAYDRFATRNAMVQEHNVLSQIIAHRSTAALAFRDKRGAKQNLEALAQQKSIVMACLYDANGDVFMAYDSSNSYHGSNSQDDGSQCPPPAGENSQAFTNDFLHVHHNIYLHDKLLGSLYVRSSLMVLKKKIQQFSLVTAIVVALVGILAFLITSRLQRVISGPVLLLSNISKRVSEDNDYTRRAEHASEDELGTLVKSFNSMMETIENAQNELKNLAFKDALTGLPNRRLFMTHLEKALNQNARSKTNLALFLIDLDGFKAVNDTLGHEAGDWVLVTVSDRLNKCIRSGDIVARLGGDEFTALFTGVGEVWAIRTIAEKICAAVDEPIYFQGKLAKVSASIGISLAPRDSNDGQELLKMADMGMYGAKKAGKNGCFFYNDELQAETRIKKDSAYRLKELLEQGGLELRIEPQYCMRDQSLVGAEVLIHERLDSQKEEEAKNIHEEILSCETKDTLERINEWILCNLAYVIQDWKQDLRTGMAGLNMTGLRIISLKMSCRQINLGNFLPLLESIAKLLSGSGIRLVIAVAEKELLNIRTRLCDALPDENFGFAVDVSGSVEVLINRWPDLPIQQVRFKCMARDCRDQGANPLDCLNQILVGLCQCLDYESVAMNITCKEQVELLNRVNCDFAQGLLFSQTKTPQAFYQLLIQGNPSAPADIHMNLREENNG